MTLSTNAPRPAATDLPSSARPSATVSAGADERGGVPHRSYHRAEIEQLEAVAQPGSPKPPTVAAPGRRKRMRRSEREEAKKITQPCSECGKRFWSWKALFGHMRCHPNRSWRGIEPPPYVRRRTSPLLPADLPPGDGQPEEAELEAAYCLILLTGQQADGDTGHDLPPSSAIKVFKCSSCDKVFDSPHGLGGHRAGHARAMRDVTTRKRKAESSEHLHSCGFCSMSFPSGQALGGHVLVHCDEECNPERAASEAGAESSSTAGNGGCGFDLNLPAPEEMMQGPRSPIVQPCRYRWRLGAPFSSPAAALATFSPRLGPSWIHVSPRLSFHPHSPSPALACSSSDLQKTLGRLPSSSSVAVGDAPEDLPLPRADRTSPRRLSRTRWLSRHPFTRGTVTRCGIRAWREVCRIGDSFVVLTSARERLGAVANPDGLAVNLGNQVLDAMEKSDSIKKLCTRMRLWEFPEQYIIEPTDGSLQSYVAISRADGSVNLIGEIPVSGTVKSPKVRSIFGVLGVLKLVVGGYLLVITERECVGSYLGHPIFKASSLQILPCNNSPHISNEQKKLEHEFSMLLNAAERTSGLYFSYDVNLTLSFQRLHALDEESKLLPLWRQADPRFLWNNYMLETLIDNKLEPFLLPVIQGSYQNFQSDVGKGKIDVTLIARRCTRRTGTRMWRRGADSEGYVANFVETEQILQSKGFTASYVQVRGSIPFLWEQIVDLTYKPRFEIVRSEEAPRVVERHFMDLRKRYGSVLAVDLVNKHGSEGRLNEKYASSMEQIISDDTRYIHFDFHSICGHTQFERLSLLYDQIEDYMEKQGYFLSDASGTKVDEQLGVIRCNCIDCLDRTNVTQSMIARKMLERQLRRLEIFNASDTISSYENFDANFKMSWANHGDEISMQYSGTPALKGDFVRYGRRTIQGILNDGRNALARYYFNNFADGAKQDAIDLLHGHYIVSVNRDMSLPLQNRRLESLTSFPLASALVLAGIVFASISLRQARQDISHLLFSVAWAGVSLGVMAFVRSNGRLFTNRPRLLLRRV